MKKLDSSQAARLNSSHPMLNLLIDRVRQYVASDTTFSGALGSTRAPRFGVFSLLLRRTPVYVYDHPALKRYCQTAFTDGTYIFFDADFLQTLVEEDKRSLEQANQSKSNVIPLLLHELAHILFHHVKDGKGQRLRNIPDGVAGIAADVEINQRLVKDFERSIRFGDYFLESAYGLREDEWLSFEDKSAETIAKMLMQNDQAGSCSKTHQETESGPTSNSKDSVSGKGRDQQDQTGGAQARCDTNQQKKQGRGPGKNHQGSTMRSAEQVLSDLRAEAASGQTEKHSISAHELEKLLRENGLGHIADALKLPKNDREAQRQQNKRQLELIDDLKQAENAREQVERIGATMPGGHCETYATVIIQDLMRPQLKWKSQVEDILVGDGAGQELLEEEPHDLYYVDPDDMHLTSEVYLPSVVPAKPNDVILCVLDTSGSVSVSQLKRYLSEIFGLREKYPDLIGDIVVFSADTVIRGEPMEITEDNWYQAMQQIKVFGRGGTNLEQSLAQSIEAARKRFGDRTLRHVLYFTDLMDVPPKRNRLPDDLPPVTFLSLSPSLTQTAAFKQAVSGFAKVIPIEEGNQVDLSRRPSETSPTFSSPFRSKRTASMGLG